MTPRDRLELVVPEEPVPPTKRDPLTWVVVVIVVGLLVLAVLREVGW